MDKQIISILVIFIIFIIGFVRTLQSHIKLVKDVKFVGEYLDKFNEFVETYNSNFDGNLYYWLTKKSPKIQTTLGLFGVSNYQPAFANHIVNNRQTIVNTLPLMRNGTAHKGDINMCQEALIRYIGFMEEAFEYSKNDLKNPLKWFQLGAQYIVSLPIRILYWFNLINKRSLNKIMDNYLFKLVSFVAIILGIIGSLITILQYFGISITLL